MKKKKKNTWTIFRDTTDKSGIDWCHQFWLFLVNKHFASKIFMSVYSKQKVLRKLIKNAKNLILDDFGLFTS